MLDKIRDLENRLLTPAVRASAEELERLLSDEFVEFGSSGRVYTKSDTIEALVADPSINANVRDSRVLIVAPGVVLATYRSGTSLRSSLWRRERDAWRIVFHQGTRSDAA
jgi:hypothetical protein